MAINNTIELIGNLADDLKVIELEGKTFGAGRIATTDSYKDEKTGEWINLQTIWHNFVAFSPMVIELLKPLKKGTRVKITGSLSYKPRPVSEDGKEFNINEASIVVRRIEQAPLVKKD